MCAHPVQRGTHGGGHGIGGRPSQHQQQWDLNAAANIRRGRAVSLGTACLRRCGGHHLFLRCVWVMLRLHPHLVRLVPALHLRRTGRLVRKYHSRGCKRPARAAGCSWTSSSSAVGVGPLHAVVDEHVLPRHPSAPVRCTAPRLPSSMRQRSDARQKTMPRRRGRGRHPREREQHTRIRMQEREGHSNSKAARIQWGRCSLHWRSVTC